ncbi:U32 family peptidase [Cyanobium sp. WAJ14-Wanaka]|uniref:U32 family peptidase n=1 Tax=Cyanobium sp. WAJ14-Wanaka TaxID=2823725 RepID=UPI0020CD204E|nr:U32 family peptidase [Cyanobium sp. WAJ14-Wanaka]MCP9774587.1 U32 family peptidase [Cyanobium sp. WAJ14-Wanaka]
MAELPTPTSAAFTPELLSPAGNWDALKAAVANGADAVYFGVEVFNARMRAANFQLAELPAVMDWLHRRGVKGFLTVNVLVFTAELEEAAQLLLAASTAQVDALIVQDIGLAMLARSLTPGLAIHGSTQMSITSAAGVAQAAALGCVRVVLARELALKDLGRIQNQLKQRQLAMPLEVFVHGALCVAYSGQCLTSEALGQRSANRGECAQACRLPYALIVDGQEQDLGDQRYLLSPQDLSAWELLPELAGIGIASLKIEGRLKDAAYVAAVTDLYRRSLDRIELGGMREEQRAIHRQSMELSFSRGLGTGWLGGVDHRQLVHGRWSKKRGPLVGQLKSIEKDGWWLLETSANLKPGDGLVWECPSPTALEVPKEIGGRVMVVERRTSRLLALRMGPGRIDARGLQKGSPCWLTSDPAFEKHWQRLAQTPTAESPQPLHLKVVGKKGMPLVVYLLGEGHGCSEWRSSTDLEPAMGQALDRNRLESQLGRLGGTPWFLESLDLDLEPGLFLPISELNRLRRQIVEQLANVGEPQAPELVESLSHNRQEIAGLIRSLGVSIAHASSPDDQPEPSPELEAGLVVLVRSLEQLKALRDLPLQRVIAELEQPHELKEAVALGRGCWPGGLWLAGARITRPNESWTIEPLIQAAADGYLVRNADQLELLTPIAPCVGDFSLNVANPITAAWYLQEWQLERVTASYDLCLEQLLELVGEIPKGCVEVTVHQHMPLFHMEHCLFCAFLSDGHDHTDCGRPCETHQVLLRDRSGSEHPLRADLGCRNTLFNGTAQTAAEALPALQRAGVRHFRLEMLNESAAEARQRVGQYGAALKGEISGRELWQRERLESRLGVTRGSLKGRS